jgi:hypothetical protein
MDLEISLSILTYYQQKLVRKYRKNSIIEICRVVNIQDKNLKDKEIFRKSNLIIPQKTLLETKK